MSGPTAGEKMGYTGAEAREKGEELLTNFFGDFKLVKTAIDQSKEFLKKNGYVEDFIGRRRRLNDINLDPYVVKLKKEDPLLNFNPFIECENRTEEDPRVKKWKIAVKDAVNKSQNWQRQRALEAGKVWEDNGEMSNKAYEKLAKDAELEGVVIEANTSRIAEAGRQCFNARIQGCLDYNSLIYTRDGIHKIGELNNQNVEVWDGDSWSNAIVLPSGKKQKCILTTSLGDEIICSPDHKFLTINTYGTKKFKKLTELNLQDRLIFEENYPVLNNKVEFRSLMPQELNTCYNKHNYSFDDIEDTYIRGQILGRIASDGSYIIRPNGSGYVYILVAEHEIELLDYFKKYLPFKYYISTIQKKNQKIYRFIISSTTLAKECQKLDIKHDIADIFFTNTELLRGFISGFFDGDGTANHNNITLDFGTQADFTNIINKFKIALNLFGIKNTVTKYLDRYRITIRRNASNLFATRIGFITKSKQDKALNKICVKTNKTFNNIQNVVCIKQIEISNEKIDMYDVCNTERGYFVVNGYITHNSAASLTKMAMIDIFNDPLLNEWDTHLIIPVHDEVLVECPAYYSSQVEERLSQVMIEAAKKGGDDIPQNCDPYNVTRWASDVCCAFIQDEFKKLTSDGKCSREEALEKMKLNHIELPETTLLDALAGNTDELIF